MARRTSTRLEDLDLSQDELNRLGEALKKEEFRDLLFQYAREINDPENKKRYEEEITQLENERGVDIKFVHPEPHYVLKTCFNPGGEKVFVNICSNSLVSKPTMKPSRDSKGASGISWSIPLIQAPPREDLDKARVICTVYDVLFHPDTHAIAAKDKKFRALLEDTALNAVEETFSVKLDRNSVKRPRMKFKGVPRPTVIRTRISGSNSTIEDGENFIQQLPYPYSMPPKEPPCVRELKSEGPHVESDPELNFISPKYTLKQSSDVDMTNYEQNHLSHHDITIPQRLILIVDLPYVKSSSELELDVEQQKLSLFSTGKRRYKLELKLAYPVLETKGNAKFDQEAGKLIVTLLVDREKAVLKKYPPPEGDSGVESDVCCGRASSSGSEEEETKGAMERETVVVKLKEPEDGSDFVKELHCELNSADDMLCNSVDMCDAAVEPQRDEVMTGSGKLREEGETIVETPKNAQPAEMFEGEPEVPEKESLTSEMHEVKCQTITMGLLLPGVQYTVPPFSCNCLREGDNMIITFVLQVKNVDPSSVEKKVFTGLRVAINAAKHKPLQDNLPNDISLAPENGSVCNEYRTVGSVIPFSGPLMTYVTPKDSVVCGFGKARDCVPDKKMEVDGAMVNDVVENKLSDKFRDSIVINENAARGPCDAITCDAEVNCFHVIFSSVGAGFFPQNYAFCVGFPQSMWPVSDLSLSEAIPVNIEVWDNNVEVQLKKSCGESAEMKEIDCFVGKDPYSMQPYTLPPFEDKVMESESFSDPEFSSLTSVSEDMREEGTKDESDSSGIGKENGEFSNGTSLTAAEKRKFFKERTLSESSVESITSKQVKGILKRSRQACLGRSLSESSGGEEYSWIGSAQHLSLSSVNSSPSLSDISRFPLAESLKEEAEEYDEEEEYDDEDGEKVKKIVRFSDVIYKQTYRSNASILGQRKKNQRKSKNKKRAAERRASESENSVDEVESSSEKANVDDVSDLSPPQSNEIPMPNNLNAMHEPADNQSVKVKSKSSAKKKGNWNKGKDRKVLEPPKSNDLPATSTSPSYEFKSDLIFQLEM